MSDGASVRLAADQAESSGAGPSPPSRAGLVQPTVIPGPAARPKIAPSGGGASARNDTQVITHPVSPRCEQSGVFLKVPPTSLPSGTSTLKPAITADSM